jgi:HSP20 family protein
MNLRNLVPLSGRSHNLSYFTPTNIADRVHDLLDGFFAEAQLMPTFDSFNRFPAMSVSENDNAIIVEAELPAMDEKDIKIDTNKNYLTISGEKKNTREEERKAYHVSELVYGKFSRSIALPFNIEADKTKASFKKGVLTVTIQKPEGQLSKSQTIPVIAEKE